MRYILHLFFCYLLMRYASSLVQFSPRFYNCPSGCAQVRCTRIGCVHCQPQYCHNMANRRWYLTCVSDCPGNSSCRALNITGTVRRFCVGRH